MGFLGLDCRRVPNTVVVLVEAQRPLILTNCCSHWNDAQWIGVSSPLVVAQKIKFYGDSDIMFESKTNEKKI